MSRPPRVPQARWVTSSYPSTSGEGLEFARFPDATIAIRHSGDPDGLWLLLDTHEMRALIEGAKAGDFDHLADPRTPEV